MKKILLGVAFIVAGTLTQAQSKDSVQYQPKKEKAEIKEADQHRLQMEKDQLQAKPEIVKDEKIAGKKTTKKNRCNANCHKKD